jgi:hypothetical protein
LYITALCPGVPVVGNGVLLNACNHDCQCSHGYGNTQNHLCTAKNNVPNNNMTYCVCGGASTLAVSTQSNAVDSSEELETAIDYLPLTVVGK